MLMLEGLLGLRMGIMRVCFHKAGRFELGRERLKREIPLGPRC